MNLILTVLGVVGPIFAVAGIGYVWVWRGYDYPQAFVTRLATGMAVPCLIFLTLVRTEIEPQALGTVVLAGIAAHVVAGVAVVAIGWLSGLDRRTYWAPMIFGNTGNVGLPLAFFAFGQEGLELAVIIFAVSAVGSFTVGVWMVSGAGQGARVLKEPIVVSCALGGLFLWQGWHVPEIIERTLDLVAQLAIPLMLITLGVAVSRLSVRALGRPLVLSLLKLAICTAAAVVVAEAFDLPEVAYAVLVLQLIMPFAVTGYIIALRAREREPDATSPDADAVAGLVVVSTALSVVALPVVLAFLVGG